jgi:hypothetical protein
LEIDILIYTETTIRLFVKNSRSIQTGFMVSPTYLPLHPDGLDSVLPVLGSRLVRQARVRPEPLGRPHHRADLEVRVRVRVKVRVKV